MRKTTGISLILLIFLSLCLMTFSLLSLSGALADEKLSRQAADRTIQYYAAVSAANRKLAEIDTLLHEHPDRITNSDLSFDITVSEEQQLHVVLTLRAPEKLHNLESDSDTMYDITEWKIVNTKDWTADRSQNLFRPDSDIMFPE